MLKSTFKSRYEMLKSTFNAQGSKVIMVVLHVWIMRIYVTTIEVHRKEKGGEDKVNFVYHKNWWFFEFHPLLNVNVLFVDFFWIWSNLWPNSRFWCCVPYHWNVHYYGLLITIFHWFNYVQACLYKVPINEDKNLNFFLGKWLFGEQGEEENGLNSGECRIAKCTWKKERQSHYFIRL